MAIKDNFRRLFGLEAVNYVNTHGFAPQDRNNALLDILNRNLTYKTPVIWYNYDQHDYIKEGYQGNAEVYTIVNKIVQKCSVPPIYLYIDKEDQKARVYKNAKKSFDNAFKHALYVNKSLDFAPENGALQKLIKQPNPSQSWVELNILFDIFYFTQGEAFLYRETALDDDKAINLYVAPSNLMTEVYGGTVDEPITGWRLNLPGGYSEILDAKDVFQLKMENPMFDVNGSQNRGQSPLLAGLKHLKLSDEALRAFVASQQNEGVKGIVAPDIEPGGWVSEDVLDVVQKRTEEALNGSQNKGKIAFSGAPIKYHNIGVSPEALQIIEGLKYANVKLCRLWGLNPLLFSDDVKYDNLFHAQKEFVKDVVLPYLNKKEDALNRWLVEPFSRYDKKNYKLDYDVSVYDELAPSKDQLAMLEGSISVNEKRILLGYETIDNPAYNDVLVASGLMMLSDLGTDIDLNS